MVKEIGVALKIREKAVVRAKAFKRELSEVEDTISGCDVIPGVAGLSQTNT